MRTLPIGTITKSVNQQEMEEENLKVEPLEGQEVKKASLKEILGKVFYGWGNYKKSENCLYLYNNDALRDEKFIELAKAHKIKIQLDLFS